jgi:hypothetical protein
MNKRSEVTKNILNYLAVFIVFSNSLIYFINDNFALRISYLIMGSLFLLWIPVMKDMAFNRVFFIPFFTLVIFSLFNVYAGLDKIELLLKQVVGISINAAWFYILIQINDYEIRKLFRIYLNISFLVASIGLFQEISFLFDFKPGYDFSYIFPFWTFHPAGNILRINSILPEPSGLVVSLMPAAFASLCSLIDKSLELQTKFRSVVIMIVFILSFSSTGYAILIISLFLILINYKRTRYASAILIFTVVFAFFAFRLSPDFRVRVVDSVNILRTKTNLEDVNYSTYALFSNALVTKKSLKLSPLIGTGLGSHEISYARFIPEIKRKEGTHLVNVQDAASLFLRLLSETGVLGLGLFLFFLLRFYLRKGDRYPVDLWVVNNSIFLYFIIRLLRVGHYFTDGFFLFFWMYYFSRIKANQEQSLK